MMAEQKYRFERIADVLAAIKDSTPPDAFSFIVEIYNKEVQEVQMRGGHWGNADFTSADIDKAIGYLFDKVELYGYEIEDIRAVTCDLLSGRQIGMRRLIIPIANLDVQITLKR